MRKSKQNKRSITTELQTIKKDDRLLCLPWCHGVKTSVVGMNAICTRHTFID
jgi:hypothetical protein